MTTRGLLARLAALVLVIFIVPSLAIAQGVGAIGGTVVDASGAVLPGVTVTLSNPGTIGGNQSTVSDERGAYQFNRLVPGRYSVRAELSGFRRAVQDGVVVNAAATARVDLSLAIGQVEEGIVVRGQAPLLDTTSVLNQTVFDREVLDTLPGMNDVWGAAKLVPAVLQNKYDVGGTEAFQQATISVHGSKGSAETTYEIDGMNVNAISGDGGTVTMYYDPFMFQEINYQAGGVSAETSRGGIAYNMVTKTGTNSFRGTFMANGSSPRLQSDNLSADLRRDLVAAIPAKALAANPNISPGGKILTMWDLGSTMSGPILRDRLWFATTGKLVRLDQLRIGSYNPDGTQFIDDNAMKTGSIKGSWAMNARSQLHYTHLYNKKERFHYSGNVTTEFAESRATVVQNLETHLNQARWTTTLSPQLVMEVSGSQTRTDFDQPPQPDVRIGDIAGYDSLTQTRLTAAPTYSITRFRRTVLHAGFSYVLSAHDLKVGYQLDHGRQTDYNWSMSHFPSGLRAVYRNGVPDSVNTYNTPTDNLAFIEDSAVFLQDKWTPIRRLTVNVGLRIERERGWQPEVCQVQTIFIDGQCFGALNDVPDFLDPAPRAALIYDVFGDGKTAVKISASRYNIGAGTGFSSRVNPNRTTSDTRPWADLNGDLMPQLNELGPSSGFNLGSTNRYNPELKRPYAAEYSIEVERQLFGDLVMSVGYYRRGTRRNIGSKNVAVPTETYVPLQVTEQTSGRQVTVYNQDPTLRGRFDVLWDNYPELDTQYNGVDISMNKRFSNRWMIMSSVSLGKNVGDIFETSDLNNPNFQFRRGVIGTDVPVSLKASGSYELPYRLLLSGSVQHYTGFPENTTVSVARNTVNLTQVTQSLIVEPRGTTRLPSVNLVDLSVRKILRYGSERTLEPVFEMYNILNASTVQARTTILGPAYGNVANTLRGRMLKFAVNAKF